MAIEETRVCSKCHIEKPISGYRYQSYIKQYRRDCKQCSWDSIKEWRLKNLDHVRKKVCQYYHENKERNRILVKVAEQYYNDGLLNASRGLFKSSLKFCQQQQWEEGVNYAIKMIEEINNKIDALNKT